MDTTFIFILSGSFVLVLCGLAGLVAAGEPHQGTGLILGLLFGPLGIIIAVAVGNRLTLAHAEGHTVVPEELHTLSLVAVGE